MAFTVIETQEQFDAAISERLKRAKESFEEKYAGYKSPEELKKITDQYDERIRSLEEAAAATQQTISEKDAKIAEGDKYRADLAKTRIAVNSGLDIKYADRLRGETEEEWKQDAEELAKDFKAARTVAPIGNPEPNSGKVSTRDQFKTWMEGQNT